MNDMRDIPVWPSGAPGALGDPGYRERTETIWGSPCIVGVKDARFDVCLPPSAARSGQSSPAILVCPGGGYGALSIALEGQRIAERLNGIGFAAAVLCYRLPSPRIMAKPEVGPLQDAQEALRILRRRSGEWALDPERIGVMGFSAGGHVAASLLTRYAEDVYRHDLTSARPDFGCLVYPVVSMREGVTHMGSREALLGARPSEESIVASSADERVGPDSPRTFIVHAMDDDAVPVENSLRYFAAMRKAGVSGELHLFERGGHGFGLGGEGSEGSWFDIFTRWARGWKSR
jgi:acetyl esterase/lipase